MLNGSFVYEELLHFDWFYKYTSKYLQILFHICAYFMVEILSLSKNKILFSSVARH